MNSPLRLMNSFVPSSGSTRNRFAPNAGALSSIFYESILTGTLDDVSAAYCLMCETMEYPEDRSWVIFNLRPEARFSDGSPLTAEDVRAHCRTNLTGYKQPRFIEFRDSLPKTNVGKILRRELREPAGRSPAAA